MGGSEETVQLLAILNDIHIVVRDLKSQVERTSDSQLRDHKLLTEHDKLLVRGGETAPSLQETIRRMGEDQNRLIQELIKERKEAREAITAEEERKKAEWGKWKWALIGLGFVIIPKTVWEVIIFYITVISPKIPHIP